MKDHHKIRAWDKDNKRFYHLKKDGFFYKRPDGTLTLTLLEFYNDLIFESCTGLKDKNGKLIYEGDGDNYGFVFYSLGQWWINFDDGDTDLLLKYLAGFEITRNINKNPELMEKG